MTAWIIMLACNLLTPIAMWAVGEAFLAWPPRKINAVVGYRTKRSMVNQETWDFANRRIALIWRRWGLGMLAAAIAGMLPLLGRASENMVYGWGMAIMALELVVMILSILPVERALKDAFDENGTRKERAE